MSYYWHVCDGQVEEYRGQEVDWRSSVIVFARSPENALIKVMKYHLGTLERICIRYEGKVIQVIS